MYSGLSSTLCFYLSLWFYFVLLLLFPLVCVYGGSANGDRIVRGRRPINEGRLIRGWEGSSAKRSLSDVSLSFTETGRLLWSGDHGLTIKAGSEVVSSSQVWLALLKQVWIMPLRQVLARQSRALCIAGGVVTGTCASWVVSTSLGSQVKSRSLLCMFRSDLASLHSQQAGPVSP